MAEVTSSSEVARPTLEEMLRAIADGRAAAPLAPVTVICPSHVAALQMRRRLAELTPFAAVRFETLPRLAELLAAGDLAAAGRRPLARPIGDHLAERIGSDAAPPLAPIRDLPGLGRALRRLFARLRRAGLRGGEPLPPGADGPHLAEVARLYALWREAIRDFYDEDDLLDAAADAVSADPARAAELGRLHLVPPGPRSASGDRLIRILESARGGLVAAAEPDPTDEVRVVLAPDRSSEAREVAREVVAALDEGVAIHEIAVLHGADPAYARLLREALAAAEVPSAAMPGVPLSETPAGRGVLALLEVAQEDLSRTALIDAFGVAPMRRDLPWGEARARLRLGRWDRLSRAAGITHGIGRWRDGIGALRDDREEQLAAAQREGLGREWLRDEIDEATEFLGVVETLWERLRDLLPERASSDFLVRLRALVSDYLDPRADGMPEVLGEIDRLGTIDAVSGTFTLSGFHQALRVNLDAASVRDGRAGEGVLIADHRAAGGLRFARVVICGAAEGLLPAGPGADVLVADASWEALRLGGHPFVEDAARRVERSRAAADRAVGCGASVVLTCPLYEGAGAHERYPSPVALAAARRREPALETATELREHPATTWLARPPSPLAAQLRGPVIDAWEAGLRSAVARVRDDAPAPGDDPLRRALAMLRARADTTLSEWDGNLAALAGGGWPAVPDPVSPTRLEQYGACGFRFLLSSILRLRVPEEPSDPQSIDPLVRGNLMHETLERFFTEQRAAGRPAVGDVWSAADERRAQDLLGERIEVARRRGLTGLAVFSRQDERTLRSDLSDFLVHDSRFRRETGAVPLAFEQRIEAVGPGGQRFVGYIDRVDRRESDGTVWIVDYKTGRKPDDAGTLGGGTLLQLPVYLLSAPAGAPATALYWYISARGGFTRVAYEATRDDQARFDRAIAAIAEGVSAGSFPAVPGEWNDYYGEFANCGRCDFTRICTRARGDDFERKADDPGTAPWARVAPAVAESDPA